MATKSILKTINITNKDQAQKFIESIELSKVEQEMWDWGVKQGLTEERLEQMIYSNRIMNRPDYISEEDDS